MSVFLGIYIEKYRTSILDYGYEGPKLSVTQDSDEEEDSEAWT